MLRSALKGDRVGGQGFRYLLATGLSALLTLSLPVLFHEVFLFSKELAVALAFMIIFGVNFFVVKAFVFRSTGGHWSQLAKFAGTTAALRGMEYLAFYGLHSLLAWNYMGVLALVLSISFCLKFAIQRALVFSG